MFNFLQIVTGKKLQFEPLKKSCYENFRLQLRKAPSDTSMAAKGEWNVGVVCNLVLIGRRKAIWVKLFRLVPVLCIVMQDVRVYHDAGFGRNVEATQRDNLVCHTCDRWLGWMQAQGFLDDLIKVF